MKHCAFPTTQHPSPPLLPPALSHLFLRVELAQVAQVGPAPARTRASKHVDIAVPRADATAMGSTSLYDGPAVLHVSPQMRV
jgi:hypothetical protein